jgi:hypothetical protein
MIFKRCQMKTPSGISSNPRVMAAWLSLAVCWIATAQVTPPNLITRPAALSSPGFAGGNSDSVSPWISSDGRFVLYSSSASDLVTNDNSWLNLDVFLRDRVGNTTLLISENQQHTGGGNGPSTAICVSTNGRYVLFESSASDLVSNDTNSLSDIFVRDCIARTTSLVKVAIGGGVGNGASMDANMTPDGRFVVFVSTATNLVVNDTNRSADVFVRDLQMQTTKLVSVGATTANATVSSPVITPDGRWVAYFSTARGLVPEVPNDSLGEIYLRDLVTEKTFWPSTNSIALVRSLMQFNSIPTPRYPVISDDGRYVAFSCGWPDCDATPPMGTTPATVLFQFDATAGTTTIVYTNGFPPSALRDDVYGPEMTPDGGFITFAARVTEGVSQFCDVRRWDQQTGSNVVVSADLNGAASTNSTSLAPVLSADGRFVTFVSNATNLVGNAIAGGWHIYRRDLLSNSNQLVDVDLLGVGSTADLLYVLPTMSSDGRFVSYSAPDGNLVENDNNKAEDVFVWDAAAGTNELLSLRDAALEAKRENATTTGVFSLSADGGRVAFASRASNLVVNDTNGFSDVFVWDRILQTNLLISVGVDGQSALGGPSFGPQISSDGRYVLFASGATNLVSSDNNGLYDVFIRDLQLQVTTLVSITTNGVSLGSYDSPLVTMTPDARYVVFARSASPSISAYFMFWGDLSSGETKQITSTPAYRYTPTLSTNGQRVTVLDSSSRLYVWNALGQTPVSFISASSTSPALSPGGNRVLYYRSGRLYCYDLNSRSNINSWLSMPIKSLPSWSSDERFVTFATGSGLVASDTNALSDVYLCDLQTGTLTLVSANAIGSSGGSGSSENPVFSGDGRFITYRSFATNLLPVASVPPGIFRFDRVTGSNQLVVARSPLPGPSWISRPAINTGGDVIAFATSDAGLTPGDLNRAADAFTCGITVLSTLDSDADGIPDWWMQQYFGHASGSADDDSRAADDADGDGMSNWEEFLAGTSPTDDASFLWMQITPTPDVGSDILLSWPAKAGRSYRVQFTDDLSSGEWQDSPDVVQVIGSKGYSSVSRTNLIRSFRVRCEE